MSCSAPNAQCFANGSTGYPTMPKLADSLSQALPPVLTRRNWLDQVGIDPGTDNAIKRWWTSKGGYRGDFATQVKGALEYDGEQLNSSLDSLDYADYGDGNSLWIYGTIYDQKGLGKGSLRVCFQEDRTALIDVVELSEKSRGTGFGRAFAAHMEDHLRSAGVRRINLTAGKEVGGYFWAQRGFEFKDSGVRERLVERLGFLWQERYGSGIPSGSPTRHAADIAALTGPDGFQIGKQTLLGQEWEATKKL